MRIASLTLAAVLGATSLTPALAQDATGPLRIEITDGVMEPLPFAIPAFFGNSAQGEKIAKLVADDLTGTGLFRQIPASAYIAQPESFLAPVNYDDWKAINAQALIMGDVSLDGGQIGVKFRLFDVYSGQPMGEGLQFSAAEADWRRLGHKVADAVYSRITGEGPYFDSRVVFVGEDGPKDARRKRIGIMDTDGAGLKWLTDDAALVMGPKVSPDGKSIAYTSYDSGFPQIKLMDVGSVTSRDLPVEMGATSFSGRFSPDGAALAYTHEKNGNSDIYTMDIASGTTTRLTDTPAIETAPSYAPDGSRIVFESDRSGTPQLYVMNARGGEATRISFGEGRYGAPVWSPAGDLIAFAKQEGGQFHIGVMRTDGSNERILTSSFLDEGPEWAPNGRVVMFTRQTPGETGVTRLHSVDITGRNMRPIEMEATASDPGWGPLLP